jgi:periplasmic divalent cation tolerance protein
MGKAKAKAVIVVSTFSTEESAAEIGKKLVEKGQCACVNFARIRSIYVWKGKLEDQPEYLAFFKVSKDSAEALKDELAKVHPYDVPEIVEIKMSDVSKPYLSWLDGSAHRVAKKRNHPAKR